MKNSVQVAVLIGALLLSGCGDKLKTGANDTPAPDTTPKVTPETLIKKPNPFIEASSLVRLWGGLELGQAVILNERPRDHLLKNNCADGELESTAIDNATRYGYEYKVLRVYDGDGKERALVSLIKSVTVINEKRELKNPQLKESYQKKAQEDSNYYSSPQFRASCGDHLIKTIYLGSKMIETYKGLYELNDISLVEKSLFVDDNDSQKLKELGAEYEKLKEEFLKTKPVNGFESSMNMSPGLLDLKETDETKQLGSFGISKLFAEKVVNLSQKPESSVELFEVLPNSALTKNEAEKIEDKNVDTEKVEDEKAETKD